MFRRILVPLDGSSLAEHALPLAARLATVSGGTITLLHISNIMLEYGSSLTAQPFMYAESMLEDDTAQTRLYLDDIARSSILKDITVHKEVTSGEVAQCLQAMTPLIFWYARRSKGNLVMMAQSMKGAISSHLPHMDVGDSNAGSWGASRNVCLVRPNFLC